MPPLSLDAHRPYQPHDRSSQHDIPPTTPPPIFGLLGTRRIPPQARPVSLSIPLNSSTRPTEPATPVLSAYRASPSHMTVTSLVHASPTLLTPAATASSIHPVVISPTPIAIDGSSLIVRREGIPRVKSFPHAADLLGNASESSNSRVVSRVASPVSSVDVRMDSLDAVIEGRHDTDAYDQFWRAEPPLPASNIGRPDSLADMYLRQRRHREERQSRVPSSQQEIGYTGSIFVPSREPDDYHQGRYSVPSNTMWPRLSPELAPFAAFDRDAQISGLSELGVIRDHYTPSAYRPRAEFMDMTSNHARSGASLSATFGDTSDVRWGDTGNADREMVDITGRRPRQVPSTAVVSPSSQPLAFAQTGSPSTSVRLGSGRSLNRRRRSLPPYGVVESSAGLSSLLAESRYQTSTGMSDSSASERHSRRSHRSSLAEISQISSAHRSQTPLNASPYLPPALANNRLIYSVGDREPPRLNNDASFIERNAEEHGGGLDAPHPAQEIRDLETREEEERSVERSIAAAVPFASATIDGTALASRYYRERLARLDALRTQPASQISLVHRYDANPSHAPLAARRELRPMLGPRRASRLAVADLLGVSAVDLGESAGGSSSAALPPASIRSRHERDDRNESSESRTRDRHLQANSQRMYTNPPHSPASSRHYREIALPYAPRPSVTMRHDVDVDMSMESDASGAYRPPGTSPDLWGEIPIDVAGGIPNDPMDPFGPHDRSVLRSLDRDYSGRRPFRLQRSFGTPERSSIMNMMGNPASRSLRTGEQRSFGELPPPRAGRYHSLFDEEWLNHHYHEHSPQTLRNAPVAPRSLSGDAQHLDISTPLQLNPNMSEVERSTVAQLVARGVTTWPSEYRRTMAATMLEHIAWGDIGQGKDMLKDEYCSVCHDEYENGSKISLTPCKHMYHQECLNTWLQTPKTSSCPMCRRDLTVLACLTKMVPGKHREEALKEALPMWMAL